MAQLLAQLLCIPIQIQALWMLAGVNGVGRRDLTQVDRSEFSVLLQEVLNWSPESCQRMHEVFCVRAHDLGSQGVVYSRVCARRNAR
jgi:hypothetical protein